MKITLTQQDADKAFTATHRKNKRKQWEVIAGSFLKDCLVATAIKRVMPEAKKVEVGIYRAWVDGITYDLPDNVGNLVEDWTAELHDVVASKLPLTFDFVPREW